jgi:beta-lactamase class A
VSGHDLVVDAAGELRAFALVDQHGDLLAGSLEQTRCYPASLIKVPLVMAVLREIDAGRLRFDTEIATSATFVSPSDGSLYSIDDDSRDPIITALGGGLLALESLMWRAIIVSSNEATNLLFDLVGFDGVAQVLALCGATNSVIQRGVFDTASRDAGRDNALTPRDAARIMHAVRVGAIVSETSSAFLRNACFAQEQRSLISAATPGDTSIGNKEGDTSRVLHDMAFVVPGTTNSHAAPYALAVFTQDLGVDAATQYIHRIARRAYDYVAMGRREGDGWS